MPRSNARPNPFFVVTEGGRRVHTPAGEWAPGYRDLNDAPLLAGLSAISKESVTLFKRFFFAADVWVYDAAQAKLRDEASFFEEETGLSAELERLEAGISEIEGRILGKEYGKDINNLIGGLNKVASRNFIRAKKLIDLFNDICRINLGDKEHFDDDMPYQVRLGMLKDYMDRHPLVDFISMAEIFLPELKEQNQRRSVPSVEGQSPQSIARPSLPAEAPETYQGLRGPETPPEFVKRVYGEWLGKGLTRAHIRKLDSKLYDAIDNWSRRNEWPADVDLPKLKEQNDRWVDRVRTEGAEAVLGQNASLTDYHRLTSAMGRRKPSGNSPDK